MICIKQTKVLAPNVALRLQLTVLSENVKPTQGNLKKTVLIRDNEIKSRPSNYSCSTLQLFNAFCTAFNGSQLCV
jgi:hypothetical protein